MPPNPMLITKALVCFGFGSFRALWGFEGLEFQQLRFCAKRTHESNIGALIITYTSFFGGFLIMIIA